MNNHIFNIGIGASQLTIRFHEERNNTYCEFPRTSFLDDFTCTSHYNPNWPLWKLRVQLHIDSNTCLDLGVSIDTNGCIQPFLWTQMLETLLTLFLLLLLPSAPSYSLILYPLSFSLYAFLGSSLPSYTLCYWSASK